jgi:Predicted membrane protein
VIVLIKGVCGLKMEQKKMVLSNVKTQDMVQVALMAALTYIATATINVPMGSILKGVVHLGDTMIFLAAVLLGRKKAFLSSAIGMCMFDLFSPYIIWAPFTFFIKGIMAYIAGTVAYRKDYNGNNIWNNIIAFSLGGIWMIAAYYVAGVLIMHFVMNVALGQALTLSIAEIPGNIAQVVAGMVLAIPLGKILKKANVIRK